MQRNSKKAWIVRAVVLTAGGLFLFGGCDPTIQATLEDGIINVANSFVGSFFQAALQVFQANAAAASNTNSNTGG